MRHFLVSRFTIIIVAMCFLLPIAHAAYAEDNYRKEVSQFIYSLGDQTIAIITNPKLRKTDKTRELTHLFLKTVDVDAIGKDAVSRYWKIIEENEKLLPEFTDLYRKHLAATYVLRFEEYTNETIKVIKVIKESNNTYYAQTKLLRSNAESININYRLRQTDSGFKIIDIEALDISLVETQRAEMRSVISRHGLPELFKRLRKKVKFLSNQTPEIIEAVDSF